MITSSEKLARQWEVKQLKCYSTDKKYIHTDPMYSES